MNDPLAMRGVQSLGDLNGEIQQPVQWPKRFPRDCPRDVFPYCLPFEQLHHDERLAFMLTEFMDGANAGVVKGRCRLCFALESL